MLQRLEFGSCYVYSREGHGAEADRARTLVAQLKRGYSRALPLYAQRIGELVDQGQLPDPGDDVTLVPVPGSSPLRKGSLWVPLLLAEALRAQNLGHDVVPLLSRVHAVKKSAYQVAKDRPTAFDHYDSFAVDVVTPPPRRVLLIDDVVTQGSTLLAAGSRIAEAYPQAEVRAFAVVRTMTRQNIDKLLAPCVGEITLRGKRGRRRP